MLILCEFSMAAGQESVSRSTMLHGKTGILPAGNLPDATRRGKVEMRLWHSLGRPRSARSIARLAILVVFAVSFLGLVGWVLDIALLKSISPRWITMRSMTAICLALQAIELALLQERPSKVRSLLILQTPGILVGGMGLLIIALYVVAMVTGREPSLVNAPFVGLFFAPSHRPALLTAILLVVSSCSLILLAAGSRRAADIAHAVILPAAIASYLVPVSYLLDVQAMTGWLDIPVGLNTGIAFCALCVAILCLRPDTWLMRVLTGEHAGGVMARKLLPALLIIPLLIGRLRLMGERAGAFASEVGVALVAVTYTACLLWLVWVSARSVNRTDEKRSDAEDALQEREEILRLFVRHAPAAVAMFDREMRYLAHSDRWRQDYGLGQGEIIGRITTKCFPKSKIVGKPFTSGACRGRPRSATRISLSGLMGGLSGSDGRSTPGGPAISRSEAS